MTQPETTAWVWVIVIEPDGDPQYLGLQDKETGEAYIPVFADKDQAQQGMLRLSLDKGKKYEAQAVLFGDLAGDAAANGFMLFLLDAEGNITDRISPGGVRE